MIANKSLGENSEFIFKAQCNLHPTDCTWLGRVLMVECSWRLKQSLHAFVLMQYVRSKGSQSPGEPEMVQLNRLDLHNNT